MQVRPSCFGRAREELAHFFEEHVLRRLQGHLCRKKLICVCGSNEAEINESNKWRYKRIGAIRITGTKRQTHDSYFRGSEE